MNEQRKEHRLRANIPIRITYQHHREVFGQTGNISRLGTYVEVDREIRAGEELEVALELPVYSEDVSVSGEVRCRGTVFRSQPVHETGGIKFYGIGIFFTAFQSDRDKEKLSRYIDHLLQREALEVTGALKRRKEKKKEQPFQKEALQLLRQISSRLEEIQRMLKTRKRA